MKKGKRRIHHRAANKLRQLFAKKQPHASESNEAADSVGAQESDEPPVPPAFHPPQQGQSGNGGNRNGAQHENDTHPSPYEREQLRLTGRLTVATIAIAIATVVYMVFSGYQSCKIRQSVEIGRQQANTAQAQANLSERSLNLAINSAAEQSNVTAKTLELTSKSVNAGEKQANASMSQAGTSRIAADAAQKTAQIALLGQLPQVEVQNFQLETFEPNQQVKVSVTLQNTGRSTARRFSVLCSLYKGPLNVEPITDDQSQTIDVSVTNMGAGILQKIPLASYDKLRPEEFDAIKKGIMGLYMIGTGRFFDDLNRYHPFSFCLAYDATTGGLIFCHENVQYKKTGKNIPSCPN